MTALISHQLNRSGIQFKTTAEKVGPEWFEWKVQLDESPEKLEKIKEVEYILHPLFPNRIRRVKKRDEQFAIKSGGWGEFDIIVNVYFQDGDEKTVIVPLKLE